MEDNAWVGINRIQFTLLFPHTVKYEVMVTGKELRILNKPKFNIPYYPSAPFSRKNESEFTECPGYIQQIEWSPDKKHFALIVRDLASGPRTDNFCIINAEQNKVVFRANKVALIRLVQIEVFGLGFRLSTYETVAVVLILFGIILIITAVIKNKNLLIVTTLFMFAFIVFYVISTVYYLSLWAVS